MDILGKVVCDHRIGDPVVAYLLDNCPRCKGKGSYGGFSIGLDGKIEVISGPRMLQQQIMKIFTELRRPSGYGFDYNLLKGVIDSSTLAAITNEITRCLSYLKYIQQSEKRRGFYYAPSEELAKIEKVSVQQDIVDPRTVIAVVVAVSVSGNQVTTKIPIRR